MSQATVDKNTPPRRLSLPQPRKFIQTRRTDNWWIAPILTLIGLGSFVIYSTWAAFQGKYYFSGHYISPFYSPALFYTPENAGAAEHSVFGLLPSWWPSWIPSSPALMILWAPGLFRFTCYYYRGAYYKAFWADPVSCAVGEPRKSYWGENRFPLIIQNIHRYFLFIALAFLACLYADVIQAMHFDDASGKSHFGIGLGTVILAVNGVLLTLYALGCHSLRHLIGGSCDTMSKGRNKAYNCVSCLNGRHMLWAWCSLFSVGFADIYVRLCSMGIWHDWRII